MEAWGWCRHMQWLHARRGVCGETACYADACNFLHSGQQHRCMQHRELLCCAIQGALVSKARLVAHAHAHLAHAITLLTQHVMQCNPHLPALQFRPLPGDGNQSAVVIKLPGDEASDVLNFVLKDEATNTWWVWPWLS